MDWSLGNILILLVVVLLGAVAGWLVMSRRSAAGKDAPVKPEATAAVEPPTATSEEPSPAEPARPEPTSPADPVKTEPATEVPAEPAAVTTAEPASVEPAATAEAASPEQMPAVEPPAVAEPPADSPTAEPPAVAEPATAAEAGPADDFRRIEGIGPKMAAALQSAGIRTYEQLGATDEAALREAVRAAGVRATASLPTWPAKARELAAARSAS
ncbi:hypothetical protein EDC02_1689 [Micromonospora sp. Llam0]|nr:hypothetical protein EDC02_1689 [Micromonospora sp. Llam0]